MTLQDALDSKFVEILCVQTCLEKVSIQELPSLINEDLCQTPSLRKREIKLKRQLEDAQLKRLALKNVKGEFSIVIYNGEKCVFREYCEVSGCLFKTTAWTIQQFPFSCSQPSKIGDYIKVIYP